ncbi:hypothetical protein PoB_003315500 [Plakobranchus ocellatus]|uniref:Uncharacterized protein n=1 Tax=Plakobranchus ocellatus TaxID=259542 RepID=A0AAV4AH08_9GAST|nr:hypothetical protein PoB_003315500 [Plakobranchus ocellatus]
MTQEGRRYLIGSNNSKNLHSSNNNNNNSSSISNNNNNININNKNAPGLNRTKGTEIIEINIFEKPDHQLSA